MASLGTTLGESDFSAIILGLLPKSYDQFLSAVTATASVLKKELNPEDLIQAVIDKHDRQFTRPSNQKEKSGDTVFYTSTGNSSNNQSKGGKRTNRDIECFNCHKKGHKKINCWAKGGGKEGQGPKSKPKKEELKKETANTADNEDSIWMAFTSDSSDKHMADDEDNEFDNFTICQDELFFDTDEESEVTNLTDQIEQQLNISQLTKYKYPYDNCDYMTDARNFTDSSNDDKNSGAAAIMAISNSDSEIEPDPYWVKVKVDELKGLGNAMEIAFSDTDSMLDLEILSEFEDSVIFTLTSTNSVCSTNEDNKRNLFQFSDDEMTSLIEDHGEDGLTTFDTSMLVNIGGAKGVQTELYDSGASCHMSPYRDHFEEYVTITPKSITAVDKQYFQAVGKGNLHIKILNSTSTTTVLLKDILHCPAMR